MELVKIEIDTVKILAKDVITLGPEAQLQIRTREAGQEIVTLLSETVPEGKQWDIIIRLGGEEIDA